MPSFFGLEIPPNRPIRFRPDVATTVVVCQAALGPLDHPSSSSDGETTAARSSASIFVQTTSDGPEDTTPPPNKKKLSIGTLRAETCEQFSFGTGLTFASGETVTVTHTGKGRSVYLSGRIEEDDDFAASSTPAPVEVTIEHDHAITISVQQFAKDYLDENGVCPLWLLLVMFRKTH